MKLGFLIAFAAFAITIFSPISSAQDPLPDLVERVKPAVVFIKTYDANGSVGRATGFFVSSGLIVSNWHVVAGARAIEVTTANGYTYHIRRIVGSNRGVDLALLQITEGSSSPFLPLATKSPRVGERIIVVGNPRGLGWTVSEGIVSAYRDDGRLIQHTADISPGSSGSPVLNMQGEVVGIIQGAIESGQHLNFAIPVGSIIALQKSPSNSNAGVDIENSAKPTAERNVTVFSDGRSNGWTNTGLLISSGQRIHITAHGEISLGNGRNSSPSGNTMVSDPNKLLRNAAAGALIAVIGDDNDDFILIGSERQFSSPRGGILFLGINEGNLRDNAGAYDALVQVGNEETIDTPLTAGNDPTAFKSIFASAPTTRAMAGPTAVWL